MKKDTLSRFFIALILGGICGIVVYSVRIPLPVLDVLHKISGTGITVFNSMIKILIYPLGCFAFIDAFRLMWSMIRGHYSGGDSVRTYIATTILAVLLAIFIGSLLYDGLGGFMDFSPWLEARENVIMSSRLVETLTRLPLEIVCALSALLGVVLAEIDKGRGEIRPPDKDAFKTMYKRFIQIIYKLYTVLPLMIFLVSFELTARTGTAVFRFVLYYVISVFVLVALHVLLVYSGTIKLKLKLSPLKFFEKSVSLMRVAGWTINSQETEPITIRTATIKLGVPEKIAENVVLGGTTLNMDGTAIMQAVAILLTANVYGIVFDSSSLWTLVLMVVITAMVTTAGTLTGMFTLGIIFHVFGVPVELLAIIISISHVVSVAVTPVNILGDLVAAMVVASDLGKLDRDVFNK